VVMTSRSGNLEKDSQKRELVLSACKYSAIE
jgi:hypothetical protein